MSTRNDPLTHLSQLDELNHQVWLKNEWHKKVNQSVSKQEFTDPLPPSENAVSAKIATTDVMEVPMLPNDDPAAALPKSGAENLPTLSNFS